MFVSKIFMTSGRIFIIPAGLGSVVARIYSKRSINIF